MSEQIENIIKGSFSKNDILYLLKTEAEEKKELFKISSAIKEKYIGKKVYFRGLIEYSNFCSKNCYYCGIRKGNHKVKRYTLLEEEVIEAARYAYENRFASLVIQSGERIDSEFTETITRLLDKINSLSNNTLGITLSLGEQTEETYRKWYNHGAKRYLLRIESSNKELYSKLHPNDSHHDYEKRIDCLKTLRKIGYQVGSGVMIGLPFQTIEYLADDLIFLRDIDIDMCGMGPYIEHEQTPLFENKNELLPLKTRFDLSLKMIAILRIMMKDINIAATTAMQTIDPQGREKALKVGANIIMPNLTPVKYRENYLLYENKPCLDEEADECKNCLEARIHISGDTIGYGEWGDSKHFEKRKK